MATEVQRGEQPSPQKEEMNKVNLTRVSPKNGYF